MQKKQIWLIKGVAMIAVAIAGVSYDAMHQRVPAADTKPPASVVADTLPDGLPAKARTLSDDAKTQLLGVIVPGRKVEIIVVKDDDEAYLYATQVMDFLKDNKREIANDGVVSKDFDVPPVPQKIFIGKTFYRIIIGHNTQK